MLEKKMHNVSKFYELKFCTSKKLFKFAALNKLIKTYTGGALIS